MSRTKKILIWSLGSLVVLIGALVAHIYISTTSIQNDPRIRQMSRIDFKEPIDSLEATKIKNAVNSLPGIDGSLFNTSNGIFVYAFYPEKQNDKNVWNRIMSIRKYNAVRYIPDPEKLKSGCPVMNKNSFSYRAIVYFYSIFN